MNKIIRDILTGIDGESFVIVKVLGFTLVLVFIVLECMAFWMQRPFDGSAYGIGAGLVVTALGAAINLTKAAEPGEKK